MRVAINGFGRIGRIFFRQAFGHPQIDIVAINDLGSLDNLAYLLKYDSVYGCYDKKIETSEKQLIVDGKRSAVLQEKNPAHLPWKDLEVDVVIESTGVFDSQEKSQPHLEAGAKRVVITAPAKDDITPTVTPNVGEENLKRERITCNASCTTNATNPVMAVMMANPGIKKAVLNTIHAYTSLQPTVDMPDKGGVFRRGRAAALNIVPYLTGAARATVKAIPSLQGKFDGLAIRVPIVSGSLIDVTFLAARPTSVAEVNEIFRKAATSSEWQGILTVTDEPLVSTDILGNSYGSIVNLDLTRVVEGDLVKIFAWYDNEWGYASMLIKHVLSLKNLL